MEYIAERGFLFPEDPVLSIWSGRKDSTSLLCKVMDRAAGACVPTIVLAESPESISTLVPPGILLRDRSADPAQVSIVLRTLCERQGAVRELLADQHRMMHAQAGLRHQMEQMQEELALASQIQQELIPRRVPEIPGLELAVICRPAGFVSGDLFSVDRLDDEHVGFFLADAVGHGVPAALFTLLIARSIRRTDHAGAILPPAQVLDALNREMVERNVTGSRFATGVYGVMNTRTGVCDIAGAGHPPPIVTRAESIERIETSGPLLGIFPDAEFTQTRVTLGARDSLVVFTDGFESAFPAAVADAYSMRLPTNDYIAHLAALGRTCRQSGQFQTSAERFEQTLDEQLGSLHQADDLTALVLSPALQEGAHRKAA
ncbi:MAG: hypothetical protein D6695_10290 [Planctomycetota bacterium]|nr:MAG: hypothetical protein D6695_10290 [Planctomycetota bacterium]